MARELHSCTIVGMVIDGVSKVKIRKYKLMALISDSGRSEIEGAILVLEKKFNFFGAPI